MLTIVTLPDTVTPSHFVSCVFISHHPIRSIIGPTHLRRPSVSCGSHHLFLEATNQRKHLQRPQTTTTRSHSRSVPSRPISQPPDPPLRVLYSVPGPTPASFTLPVRIERALSASSHPYSIPTSFVICSILRSSRPAPGQLLTRSRLPFLPAAHRLTLGAYCRPNSETILILAGGSGSVNRLEQADSVNRPGPCCNSSYLPSPI